jgi:hypothetical protein
MTQAYLISRSLDEFAAAREQFAQLIQALQSEPNLKREHGGHRGADLARWPRAFKASITRLLSGAV